MDWRIKGLTQGLLARLPGGVAINDLLQVWQGGRRDTASHVAAKVRADWLVMMQMLHDARIGVSGRSVLEIGTGWLPVLPVCFLLAGARQVHTFDLRRHMRADAWATVLAHIEPLLGEIAAGSGEPEPVVRGRLQTLRQHAGIGTAADAGIRYHAPADASATGLPDGSVDLIISNSVLEHVTPAVLQPLMLESARLIGDSGHVLHSVNCGDHYAYFDRRISPIHYLRFSDAEWRMWNNDILYQNRLRPSDFIEAARSGGLQVLHRIQTVRHTLMQQSPPPVIAEAFKHYSDEDLCTTSVSFLACRQADSPGANDPISGERPNGFMTRHDRG